MSPTPPPDNGNPLSSGIDVAAIIATAVHGARPSHERGEREAFEDAERQLEKGRQDEIDIAIARTLHEQHQDIASNRVLREDFGNKSFEYLKNVTIAVFAILFIHSIIPKGTGLPSEVLVTIAGGSFASAIGLVGFVIKGLFSTPNQNRPKRLLQKAMNGRLKSHRRKAHTQDQE